MKPMLSFFLAIFCSCFFGFDLAFAASEKAIFAGGCFWCMQPPFDALKDKGVQKVTVGYTGGAKDQPTYKDVSAGGTGHREAVEVVFNPEKISYGALLDTYWKNIDPTDAAGQFCDKGDSYTSAIFYTSDQQKKTAEESKEKLKKGKTSRGRNLNLTGKNVFSGGGIPSELLL